MKSRCVLSLLLFGLSAGTAAAQVPAGPEFRVNTFTPGSQFTGSPGSVAADWAGNFVVTWASAVQDGSDYGVFVRRYDPAGVPLGPELQVNTYTTGRQSGSVVAAAGGAGSFVVSWTSVGQDGSDRGVFARRFSAAGAPIGAEFQVNSYTTGGQGASAAAMDPAGNFVIAWGGAGAGDSYGVFLRRFDASGTPLGPELRVNTQTADDQTRPAVAMDPGGRFVVAWESSAFSANDFGIRAQRFDAAGTPSGPAFRVDTPEALTILYSGPSMAMDFAGNFVVVWWDYNYFPPMGKWGLGGPGATGVYGQRFSASGAPRGPEFTVHQSGFTYHDAAAASDAAGNFIVVFDGVSDGGGSGVMARRYDAAGVPRQGAFPVNTTSLGDQQRPVVASDVWGRLFSAWTSNGQDGSAHGVYAQRFGDIAPMALVLDTAPWAGANGNGVLEPGESVDVGPFWRNLTGAPLAVTGDILSFTGPPASGVSYLLQDAVGSYGTIPDGVTAVCTNCYQVAIGYGGTRPTQHWHATLTETLSPAALGRTKPWALHVGGSFTDVPGGSPYFRFVETIFHAEVTGGCAAGLYCPGALTTREQMAAFVLLAKQGPGYTPPACSPPNTFADVPETSIFCDVIEELARRGVVGGCGGGLYCPTAAVPREQMPVFALLTLDPALNPPACGTPMFADVPASSPYCRWIEELARRGVVGGCGGGLYCPTAPVTREQMAVFVSGTFGLTLYGP
jgi:hypothetical protein